MVRIAFALSSARVSRVLATTSRHRGLFRKDCFSETPKPAREARALPRPRKSDFQIARLVGAHGMVEIARLSSPELAIHNMQRAPLHRHRGFFHRFAQGWMRVAGPPEIFAAAAKLNHRSWFGN